MLRASPFLISKAEPEMTGYFSLKHDSDSWLTFSTQEVGSAVMRKMRACYFGGSIFLEESYQNKIPHLLNI